MKVRLGSYNPHLARAEFCEMLELCCEKESHRSAISCPPGESENITWPAVQKFAHVRVLPPHDDANEQIAKEDPLRPVHHRWHRNALHLPGPVRGPSARST